MITVSRLIEQVLIDKFFKPAPQSVMTKNIGQGIIILSGILSCVGLGFLMYGAHVWLLEYYSAAIAAVITGGLSFLFAGLLWGGTYAAIQYRQNHIRKFRHRMVGNVQSLFGAVEGEVGKHIAEHPKMSLLVAAIAGLVLTEEVIRELKAPAKRSSQ